MFLGTAEVRVLLERAACATRRSVELHADVGLSVRVVRPDEADIAEGRMALDADSVANSRHVGGGCGVGLCLRLGHESEPGWGVQGGAEW